MPELNSQVGAPVAAYFPPEFDGFEVIEGTWKPKDLLKDKDHSNAKGVIFNTCFWGPGTEISCEMMQYLTDPPATPFAKSQVISEKLTADNPDPGKWLVLKCDPSNFGPDGIIYSVTLRRTADQDLDNTTPVP